ncbi:MAG: hypothetical protein ACXWG1_11730 [Usitatibacter sp.]
MKKILAIGLACCLPIGLAAEDSNPAEAFLGTMNVLVVDDAQGAGDCGHARAGDGADCMSFNRAVLTARIQKVSVLHERGRWL